MSWHGKSVLPLAQKIRLVLGAQPQKKHFNFYDVRFLLK
jgi:hypothetical protein